MRTLPLSASEDHEVATVLRAWLESLAPGSTGDAEQGASRIASCIASLEPYPHLHAAVKPLLSPRS